MGVVSIAVEIADHDDSDDLSKGKDVNDEESGDQARNLGRTPWVTGGGGFAVIYGDELMSV